jgi:hypothetical protein
MGLPDACAGAAEVAAALFFQPKRRTSQSFMAKDGCRNALGGMVNLNMARTFCRYGVARDSPSNDRLG